MILISHVTCSAFGLGGDCDVAAAGSLVLKLVVGLCALGVLSASDQVGGVLSAGSINGADVRPGSVLRRTASLVLESLGGALLARALAMWREYTPNGDHKRL